MLDSDPYPDSMNPNPDSTQIRGSCDRSGYSVPENSVTNMYHAKNCFYSSAGQEKNG